MSKGHVDFVLFFSYATSSALFLQNQQEKTIMTGSNAEEIAYSLFTEILWCADSAGSKPLNFLYD